MSRFFLLFALLFLGLAAYFAFINETPSAAAGDGPDSPQTSSTTEDAHKGATLDRGVQATTLGASLPCMPIGEFVAGPDGYRLDSWFMSWGAPPIGVTPNPASAYSWYDNETLFEMDEAGDAIAKHERGRRLVISALTGVRSLPNESTIWDIAVDSEELPLIRSINGDKLSEGRETLFDAAVLGRTYALIEIAISYALEQQALAAAGEVSSEALTDLRVKSFAFGESAEQIVPALHSSFFQSSVPSELKPTAMRESNEISGRVLSERSKLGIALTQIDEETERIFDSLRICRD